MALINVGSVVASTFNERNMEVADEVTSRVGILNILKDKGCIKIVNGGAKFSDPLMEGTDANIGSIGKNDTKTIVREDKIDSAYYAHKIVVAPVVINELDKARNSGASKIFDFFKTEKERIQAGLTNTIEDMLAKDGTGNGSKDIAGLDYLFPEAPTSGTVGEINAGTWSFWRNQYRDVGADFDSQSGFSTNMAGREEIQSYFKKCSYGGRTPDMFASCETLYNFYHNDIVTNLRVNPEANKRLADAGIPSIKYGGADWVSSQKITDANLRLYILTSSSIKFKMLKNLAFNALPPKQDMYNPLNEIVWLVVVGNLTCNSRRRNAVLFS